MQVAPTFEKTPEEAERLNGYIAKTALLAYLDSKAKETVIGAFQKKVCSKDEEVIKQVIRPSETMHILERRSETIMHSSRQHQSKKFMNCRCYGHCLVFKKNFTNSYHVFTGTASRKYYQE